jgi:hypothetical protein
VLLGREVQRGLGKILNPRKLKQKVIMKIFIATPMYGGMAKSVYIAGISDLNKELSAKGHSVIHTSITNESLITRARNTLANEFMKSDYDALLFIDADHGFIASDIVKMIESGKDLIGAPYPMKAIDWNNVRKAALAGKENLEAYSGLFAINFLDEAQTFRGDEPFKVKDVGTGMMFIHRTVFEQLEKVCKKYKYNTVGDVVPFGEEIVEYFTTLITPEPESVLLSEDYAFCRMWREIGGDVWAAPWVRISHAGEYNFSGRLLATLEIGQVNSIEDNQKTVE